jgi:hypothetical protein
MACGEWLDCDHSRHGYFNGRHMDMGTAGNHLKCDCDLRDFNPQAVTEYSDREIEW